MNENEIEWLEDCCFVRDAFIIVKVAHHEKLDADYWVFYAGRFWDGDENMWTEDIRSALISDLEEAEKCLKEAQEDSPKAMLRRVRYTIGSPNFF